MPEGIRRQRRRLLLRKRRRRRRTLPGQPRNRQRANVPNRGRILLELGQTSDDDAVAFAEGTVTMWANLLTLMATHLCDQGVPRSEVLAMLTMLHDTNQVTIRSPRAKASAASHLMAVYKALETS